MPALDGAFPLTEVQHGAVHVAKHLNLDVSWPLDVFLDVDGIVTERVLRFALRSGERTGQFIGVTYDAHTLAASAGGGLQQHGKPELLCHSQCLVGIAQRRRRARHDRNACRDDECARRRLGTQRRDRLSGWSHPDQARIAHGARKPLALRKKSVARMNRIRAGGASSVQDTLADEVTLRRRRGTDVHRFVSLAHVRRRDVGVAVDGDAGDAELAAGTNDSQGDLATIGDEELGNHVVSEWNVAVLLRRIPVTLSGE